ncbi:MAG: response regulator transcription factor [Verrucomicrobiota bacterium]
MTASSKTTRILLVDDHLIVRKGLASLLDDEPDLEVVAEASSGGEAIAWLAENKADLIILDLRLRDMSGIDVAAELPGARILMLSSFMHEDEIRRAFEVGAIGYLSKDKSSEELLDAVRKAAQGEKVMPAEISLLLAKSEFSNHLSERELETLRHIARGRANKEIASELSISENTVKNHVKSILSKLEVHDRTHAVTVAVKRGLIQLEAL